ncbi:MAG: methionine--tRNA ligase subunit beta [Candidatus Omnitrophica bacterium]|nr:methionine--tRNA ligase subunit beta [Candidatus Omnitrophota bacterium]
MITIEDFAKVELALGQVLEVKDHPNADRLYVLLVDLGEEKRQIVAGIRKFYTKEELVGKKVVVVKNLQPALLRGEESQGMLLAVKDTEQLSVLTIERPVALGSRVS